MRRVRRVGEGKEEGRERQRQRERRAKRRRKDEPNANNFPVFALCISTLVYASVFPILPCLDQRSVPAQEIERGREGREKLTLTHDLAFQEHLFPEEGCSHVSVVPHSGLALILSSLSSHPASPANARRVADRASKGDAAKEEERKRAEARRRGRLT